MLIADKHMWAAVVLCRESVVLQNDHNTGDHIQSVNSKQILRFDFYLQTSNRIVSQG